MILLVIAPWPFCQPWLIWQLEGLFFGAGSNQPSECSLKSRWISEGVASRCAVRRSISSVVFLSNDSPVAGWESWRQNCGTCRLTCMLWMTCAQNGQDIGQNRMRKIGKRENVKFLSRIYFRNPRGDIYWIYVSNLLRRRFHRFHPFSPKRIRVSKEKAGRRGKTGHQSGSILDWCHRCTSERWGQTLDKFPHEQSCLDSILQAILFIFQDYLNDKMATKTIFIHQVTTTLIWIWCSHPTPKTGETNIGPKPQATRSVSIVGMDWDEFVLNQRTDCNLSCFKLKP